MPKSRRYISGWKCLSCGQSGTGTILTFIASAYHGSPSSPCPKDNPDVTLIFDEQPTQ